MASEGRGLIDRADEGRMAAVGTRGATVSAHSDGIAESGSHSSANGDDLASSVWTGTMAGAGSGSGSGIGSTEATAAETTGTLEASGDVGAGAGTSREIDVRGDDGGVGSFTSVGRKVGDSEERMGRDGEETGADSTGPRGSVGGTDGRAVGAISGLLRFTKNRFHRLREDSHVGGGPALRIRTFGGQSRSPRPFLTTRSSSHTCVLQLVVVLANDSVCVLVSTIKAFFGSSPGGGGGAG